MRCAELSSDSRLMPSHQPAFDESAQTEHRDKPTATLARQTCEWALSKSTGAHLAETADVGGIDDDIRMRGANPDEKTRRDMTEHNTSHRTDRSGTWES